MKNVEKQKGKGKKAARRSGGFLYEAEKKLLIKWAEKLPLFFTPDRLTAIALIAAALIGLSFYLARFSKYWLLATVVFWFIHWWADSLDGTVARVRKITRERYGYYLDHLCDMLTVVIVVLGIGFSGLMQIHWALSVIIAYFFVSINTYLAAYTQAKFSAAGGGLGATEARLLIVILTLINFFFGFPVVLFKLKYLGVITLFDLTGIIALALLVYASISAVINNLRYLNRIDKKTYKEMSLGEVFEKFEFVKKLQGSDLGRFLSGEELEKEIKKLPSLFKQNMQNREKS
ncbi:MAG: CDP-alcohol phosphatidyltransferase family protein [Candidatus Pacearchaeota archaeon]